MLDYVRIYGLRTVVFRHSSIYGGRFELFDLLKKILDIKMNYIQLPPRISDQKVFVADITKSKNLLDGGLW